MSEVKVGDRVRRAGANGWEGQVVGTDSLYVYVKRDDGVEGSGFDKSWCVSHGAVESGFYAVLDGATPNAPGWDYAEADRLRKAAADALAAYNEYAERKPATAHYPITIPWELLNV